MRVCHIAYKYGLEKTDGATIAATRLHKALLEHGIESHYICVYQCESGINVYQCPNGLIRGIYRFLTKAARCVWQWTPYRRKIYINIIPLWGIQKALARIAPDVVHVQWINADVTTYEQLAKLPYKIVFSLHDLFLLNAIEPYPLMDRRFIDGFCKGNSVWIERWLFGRKRKMVELLNPVFVGPSEWVCGECRKSIIGSGHQSYVISNVISPEFFRIPNVSAKIVPNTRRFVLIFGAHLGCANPTKGFDDLVRALHLLPDAIKARTELRVFGESADDCEIEGVPVRFLGVVDGPCKMIEVLSDADVLAFPSRAETQGMIKIEAMLCGLPVVAFARSACADGIFHGKSGWIADNDDIQGFANGIVYFFNFWEQGNIKAVRDATIAHAKGLYSSDCIIKSLQQVYENLGRELIRDDIRKLKGDIAKGV